MTLKPSLRPVPQLERLTSTEADTNLLEMLMPEPQFKQIHKSSVTIVCTAQLRRSADAVVLKIATHADAVERLKHEYETYCRLQAMQGDQIPHCYGLFLPRCGEGGTVSRRLPGACLLLEYCGEHYRIGQSPPPGELHRDRALDEMPWKFRLAMMSRFSWYGLVFIVTSLQEAPRSMRRKPTQSRRRNARFSRRQRFSAQKRG